MKKLIAVMAAACALGAFAETWSGAEEVDFSTEEAGAWTVPEEGWTQNSGTGLIDDFSLEIAGEENDRYLNLETPQDGTLAKTIATAKDVQAGWNVNVETVVKFTPFDTKPTIDETAKIAVYYLAQDAEGEEGQDDYVPGQTNLMVTAAKLDAAGGKTKTDIALAIDDFDPAEFHTLKVESLGNVAKPEETPCLGFVIYVDGEQVEAAESLITPAINYLTEEAYALGTKLFPCLTGGGELAAVAFRGNGSLQKIAIDAKEGEIKVITPTSDYWVASNVTPTKAAPGAEITMTLTAQDGYLFADGTSEKKGITGTLESDGTVTINDEPQTKEVVAVNQVTGDKYISLKTALDAVAGLEQEETEIDIKVACKYGDDGFELVADDILVIMGTITVDKDGIKLATEKTTLLVSGTPAECDFITSGVDGFVAKFNEDESTWYLEESAEDVAKIGDQGYKTLAEAFAAADDGDEIVMLADVTLSERIFIGSNDGDKDITLDLAGKTITWDANVDNASGVFIVRSGSKLTVEDSSGTNAGKIDANGKAYAAIAITHGTYQDNAKTASLIVNGGTLVGFYQGIVGNGTRPNTYVEINGGVITATNTTAADGNLAIFNPQANSTVVINGGTLTGLWAAIEMRGGTLTVNNGTLTATAEAYEVKPNGSGSTTAGAAVAVAQHTTEGDIEVEIVGGTLTGVKAVSVANPQKNSTDNVAVTLGDATYNGELAFSADGNATVTNDGADLAAPAGYVWGADGKLVKIAEPTAEVITIADANHEAAVKFTADKIGAGYDDWTGEFILIPDQAIGEGEIKLGGSYAAYNDGAWIDIDFPACEANAEISVLGLAGFDDIKVPTIFDTIKEFSCGVKNIGLKTDTTFTLKFVIKKDDVTEEICKIENLKVEKAEDNPWKDIEEADIEGDVTPENKEAVENTLGTIAENLGDGAGATEVAAWITKVYGNQKVAVATVAAAKNIDISVKYDLPLMTAEQPTVEIKQAVDAEAKPVEGFTFQIKDGDTAVSLEAAAEKIQSMVQFTTALDDATKPFATSTEENVNVGLSEDKKTATAKFTKATAAGFMKVELK